MRFGADKKSTDEPQSSLESKLFPEKVMETKLAV
jgi:hypothetical protein